MAGVFLRAKWRDLFLATYAVPPALLQPRLPRGCELDTIGGDAFVSLVAFRFLDTRVFGVSWPGYRDFGEINLRFYVRHNGERGVVFIREFVPQRLVAWMAWFLYNEPYLAAPIAVDVSETAGEVKCAYRLTYAGRTHTIDVTGAKPSYEPGPETLEHHFKEEHWGFGTLRNGRPIRYWVEHPVWRVHPVTAHKIDLDFGAVYGAEWAFLSQATPYHTALAVGSEISVSPKGALPGA